jgi:thioredoxin reductase
MQDRVIAKDNITIYWNSETDDILGEHKVEGVRLKNNKSNEFSEIKVEGFFVAIGHKPNSDIFKGWLVVMSNHDWVELLTGEKVERETGKTTPIADREIKWAIENLKQAAAKVSKLLNKEL